METKGISLFNAFLMFILILFWGSSFVAVKMVLMEGLSPIAIATFVFLLQAGFSLLRFCLKEKG